MSTWSVPAAVRHDKPADSHGVSSCVVALGSWWEIIRFPAAGSTERAGSGDGDAGANALAPCRRAGFDMHTSIIALGGSTLNGGEKLPGTCVLLGVDEHAAGAW